jgi:hypothetical protein
MQQTVTAPHPVARLEGSLGELRTQIDLVLRSVPDNRLEARRIVTRELGIEPQPKELEAIVRMAHDPLSRGSLREPSCTALALRILAERSVRELMEPNNPSVENIARAAKLMSGLLETVNTWEEELHHKSETLADTERDFLLEVADALLPDAESLIAGTILAPRLLAIISAAEQGDPRAAVSTLTDEEVGLIFATFGRNGSPIECGGTAGVSAATLRTVIEDDVIAWRQLEAEEPKGPEATAERREMLHRLRKERTAYRFVTRLLQKRQEAALGAGLEDFSDQLLSIQRNLFAAYLELIPILNAQGVPADPQTATDEKEAAQQLDRLLRESARLDTVADATRSGRVTAEEACLDALKKLDEPETAVVSDESAGRDPRKERKRLKVMLGIASVLLLACLFVYGSMFFVHASVSSWAWRDLGVPERIEGVRRLGAGAGGRGFEAVYLTDENKVQLAVWTRKEGVRLAGEQP